MSTKELAYHYIDMLNERQLDAIVGIMKVFSLEAVPEVEPDEWDREMIARAETENDGGSVKFEDLAEELGINVNEL